MAKSGAHYSYGQDRLGKGRDDAKGFLEQRPEIALEVEEDIYVASGIGGELVTPIGLEEGEGSEATAA